MRGKGRTFNHLRKTVGNPFDMPINSSLYACRPLSRMRRKYGTLPRQDDGKVLPMRDLVHLPAVRHQRYHVLLYPVYRDWKARLSTSPNASRLSLHPRSLKSTKYFERNVRMKWCSHPKLQKGQEEGLSGSRPGVLGRKWMIGRL